jgi:hypothetical protein
MDVLEAQVDAAGAVLLVGVQSNVENELLRGAACALGNGCGCGCDGCGCLLFQDWAYNRIWFGLPEGRRMRLRYFIRAGMDEGDTRLSLSTGDVVLPLLPLLQVGSDVPIVVEFEISRR